MILGDGGAAHQEIVRILVDAGADVGIADSDGVTSLQHARRSGYDEIVRILSRPIRRHEVGARDVAYAFPVSSDAMEVVNRWRASNFERGAVEDVLAEDVEWVVPKGGGIATLRGIDAVLGWYGGGGATDEGASEDLGDVASLDVSEERGELEDFGDGRVGSLNRLIYTRESGEVAEVRSHRLVYTVRDGKIVRYELENLDESEVAGGSPN